MMISGLHPPAVALSASSGGSGTSTSSSASTDGLNPDDFMSLLVAEIQNQDPTNPMDPTTFMSQLVDLNQLEQVTQINQVVQQFNAAATATGSVPTTS
jgi:flagellar basal-body rod modification protein FlgD